MRYNELENTLSQARMNRYLFACRGDRRKTIRLYRYNLLLCKEMYAIVGIFEIALRNKINQHYLTHFGDTEWLKTQCSPTGFLSNPRFASGGFRSRTIVLNTIRKLGTGYTHDRLVADLSFGFWVNLFATMQFRFGGQNLHRIFIARPSGLLPRQIYLDLTELLDYRNRIAHHEPVCFQRLYNNIDILFTRTNHQRVHTYFTWLGVSPSRILRGIDKVDIILSKIDRI
jgi:hypothetical protein